MSTFQNWNDIETQYDTQADIFTLCLAENFQGYIEYFRDAIENEVLVGFTSNDAIVLIDVWGAAERLNFNPVQHESRSAFLDQESGVLTVTFGNDPVTEWKETDVDNVHVGYSDAGKLVGFQIIDGLANLAPTPTDVM